MSEVGSSRFGMGKLSAAAEKGELKKASREHDQEIVLRRRAMVENLKLLCQERGLTRKGLTKKVLSQLMLQEPDKFFNLKNVDSVLEKYFMNGVEVLKDLVFGETSQK